MSSKVMVLDDVEFTRFSDIEQLHHLSAHILKSQEFFEKKGEHISPFELAFNQKDIQYKAKIKLHGSNAGIVITKNGLRPQSRNQLLDQHHAFGKMVYAHYDYYRSLLTEEIEKLYGKVTIFGEFCGKGVQKKVALSLLDFTLFAVFCIQLGDSQILYEPKQIEQFLTKNHSVPLPSNVFVLPWHHSEPLPMQFLEKKQLQAQADKINEYVQSIDHEDPWVFQMFGKKGCGEGLVLYPISLAVHKSVTSISSDPIHVIPCNIFSAFVFKAKGEKHQIIKQKKAAQVNPEMVSGVNEFVSMVLTEERLRQGLQEVTNSHGSASFANIGKFATWIKNDIQKEATVELEANGLQWKSVLPLISTKSVEWYKKKIATNVK